MNCSVIVIVFICVSADVERVIVRVLRCLVGAVVNKYLCHRVAGSNLLAFRCGLLINNIVLILHTEVRYLLINNSLLIKKRSCLFNGKSDTLRHRNLFRSGADFKQNFSTFLYRGLVFY